MLPELVSNYVCDDSPDWNLSLALVVGMTLVVVVDDDGDDEDDVDDDDNDYHDDDDCD